MLFQDRTDAGRRLADRLRHLRHLLGPDVVVVGLPRGGVPVAYEVAVALDAPLEVIVVRKLGVPFQHELAMGALGEDGTVVLDDRIVRMAAVTADEIGAVEQRERAELDRRVRLLRARHRTVPLEGRTVVIVDDGIATGSTARAACAVARAQGAARVVLAVPVAPQDWTRDLAGAADEYLCLDTPAEFFAVGQWYRDFRPTTDDDVVALLARRDAALASRTRAAHAAEAAVAGATGDDPPLVDAEVTLDAGAVRLGGHLTVPERARGLVIFVHGSGSSRHSPRNRAVAECLQGAGLATLLFDLLTPAEERDRANVFDLELLAGRLRDITAWAATRPELQGLSVGWFGASTGAGAALWAAAEPSSTVAAVVSRGGRPDLAGARLATVRAPTLLVVGGADDVVLRLNRQAAQRMHCEHRLVVVPGATHLFEEPGTLQAAAEAARDWFIDHFTAGHRAA